MTKTFSIVNFILFFFLASFAELRAQEAIITLRDSVKVRTTIMYIIENQVKTKAGILGLGEIYSVRFQTEADAKQELVVPLMNAGVEVYAANKKLSDADASRSPLLVKPKENKPSNNQAGSSKEDSNSNSNPPTIGVGLGWDYGFIGGRVTVPVTSGFGLFAGGGYTLSDFGYNLGMMAFLSNQKRVVPTISFMYGTNASIYVDGAPKLSKSFTGTTLGLGIMTRNRSTPENYWHFQLLLPFRSSDFDNYYNNLINSGAIQSSSKPLPVNISVGYHFMIN